MTPDLCDTNLRVADLRGLNLRGALLCYSSLQRAFLLDADLRYANLTHADLREANLTRADLGHSYLGDVNFNDAKFNNTDFLEASFWHTVLGHVDLRGANNLETVRHHGPSSIGIHTIYISHDNLTEQFLRRCGVPENFITYMNALTVEPIEFYSCFISYSNKDKEFAKRLYVDLQNENVRCWFAPEDLKIGEKFRVRIDESIRLHDKLLIVLSEHSVASRWVAKEVETAFEKEVEQEKIILFPVRVDDAIFEIKTGWAADVRRSRHIGDFTGWKHHDSYQQAFAKLIRDLTADDHKAPFA